LSVVDEEESADVVRNATFDKDDVRQTQLFGELKSVFGNLQGLFLYIKKLQHNDFMKHIAAD
jgi:hypothetical protein